jgi:hypothetical protein
MRIWLFIKLRDLALRIYGYEHFGGGFSENTMTIYARKLARK